MNRDPEVWATLGHALRDARTRLGLSAAQLAERAETPGSTVASRTVYAFERAESIPKRGSKPQKLEQVAAALGWQPGYVDRILAGESPAKVLGIDDAPAPDAAS